MQDSDSHVPPNAPRAEESGPILLAHRPPVVSSLSHSANESAAPHGKGPPILAPVALPRAPDSEAIVTVLTGTQAGLFAATYGTPMTIGRAPDADLVVEDAGVSPHHVRIARAPGKGYYVEDLGSTTGTFLGTAPIGVALLRDGDRLQLGPNVQARFMVVAPVAPRVLHGEVLTPSGRDALTHAYDRWSLHERLVGEIVHAQRAKTGLGALAIDLDGLKDVNDRCGRLVGDRVLRTMAARIHGLLGEEDTLARHGGDEFVVLAVGSRGAEALDLAERVRRAAEDLHCGRDVRVTVSIGVAFLTEITAGLDPARALLATARTRMHRAQAAGANRVCSAE